LMFQEISEVMGYLPKNAQRQDYVDAVIESNCCGKVTTATRKATLQRLSELYGLSPEITIFRIFREIWYGTDAEKSVLAMLLALARDPLLRQSAQAVFSLQFGAELTKSAMTRALQTTFGSRFNEAVLDKVVRNTTSSWTQSGHFSGRVFKQRQQAKIDPYTSCFALMLAYLSGYRSVGLLQSPWAQALDRSSGEVERFAVEASKRGLMDVKAGGGIFDISFNAFLTESERKLLHESH
jgi:hypothetical protein